MSAEALSSDTSADSTPGSFISATRTVWAQISQSMPSTFSCTWRSSAIAVAGAMSSIAIMATESVRINPPGLSKPEKVAGVDDGAIALVRLHAVRPLVDGKQNASLESVLLVQQQGRRADQEQSSAAVWIARASGSHMPVVLPLGLDEEAQIRPGIIQLQERRTIAVDQAVIADVAPAIAVVGDAPFVSRAGPEVMHPRGIAARDGECRRGTRSTTPALSLRRNGGAGEDRGLEPRAVADRLDVEPPGADRLDAR